MATRDNQWIIKVGQWYLAHPRGEWTKKPGEAYGYHYKGGGTGPNALTGAEDEAINWRRFVAFQSPNAPGMLPAGGLKRGDGRSVQVMRRKDALELTPEAPPPERGNTPPPGVMDAKPIVALLIDKDGKTVGAVDAKEYLDTGVIIVLPSMDEGQRVFMYQPVGRPSDGYRFVEANVKFIGDRLEAAKQLLARVERPE